MTLRPLRLCRSWLFCAGADESAQATALESRPDVLIPDLEDFTPPARRAAGRELIVRLLSVCREHGVVASVRINPLDQGGLEDLQEVMKGRPDIVFLPKTALPDQVVALDRAIAELERSCQIVPGSTRIVPNVETAAGLLATAEIARASSRIGACLVASEDMATDLGAERCPDGLELHYIRQRFIVECTGAGVLAIDAPYTFSDAEGVRRDTEFARRLGYKAKSLVSFHHTAIVNDVLTPSQSQVERARRVCAAFDRARAAGYDRVELDGSLIEVPTYLNAVRLIERFQALNGCDLTGAT